MNVIGVDVSTSSGVALGDGTLLRITLRTGAKDPARRLHELSSTFDRILRLHPPKPTLAVLEGPSHGGPGVTGKLTLASLRAVILLRLFELDVPAVLVAPTALKRYATGNGNAPKEKMIAAAIAEGAAPRNDDEADAYFLRHMGRAHLGLERLELPHRIEIESSIEWPR